MYDDPSFYTFAPSVQSPRLKPRRDNLTSLLEQQKPQANDALGESHALEPLEEKLSDLPKPALSRRAQSYTDFHHAVQTVICPDTPSRALRSRGRSLNAEEPSSAVNETNEFVDWYSKLEDTLMDHGEDEFGSYLTELHFAESYLQQLSSSTNKAMANLGVLSHSFEHVSLQTAVVQKQCHDLVTDQQKLEELANEIKDNLRYYSYLEPITRKLNTPTATGFIRGTDFSDMLARLDECLEYMNSHPDQKEASSYRSRYRLLMTRGLTLIKVRFTAALQEISQDVTKRISEKQLNETTMTTLLYAKFRVGAKDLKELAQEIQARTILPPGAELGAESEYQGLMNELYQAYASTRGRLIMPIVTKKIQDISVAPSSAENLVTFARSSIVYVKGICQDEWDLWKEWFSGEAGVYDFLEAVCEPLYDYLRPRIIHENQLLRLCELCTLLQTRYFREDDEDSEMIDPHKFDFAPLIQPALEDAQTRLVFRAMAILRDEVERFKPKNTDLDYPAKLQAHSSNTADRAPVMSGRKNSVNGDMLRDPTILEDIATADGPFIFGGENTMESWFPTLKKCIWLLSRIYRLVNSTVFDDLAHNIVHQTTLSLQRASIQIGSKKSQLDGQLFLLKHLLILKQQIVAFDIEFVTPEISVDFSGMTSTFWELRQRGSLFDPRAIWSSLSQNSGFLPRVVENMLDAKTELDSSLRTVIGDLVSDVAGKITAELKKQPGSLSPDGQQHETALASAIASFDSAGAMRATFRLAEEQVHVLRTKLDTYVTDARTRETLVYAVQEQVLQDYGSFYGRWKAVSESSGNAIESKGKETEKILDEDAFGEWAAPVFGIRSAVLEPTNIDPPHAATNSSNDTQSQSKRDDSMPDIGSRRLSGGSSGNLAIGGDDDLNDNYNEEEDKRDTDSESSRGRDRE